MEKNGGNVQPISVLWIGEAFDLPAVHWMIGLKNAGIDVEVITGPQCRYIGFLRKAGLDVSLIGIRSRIDFAAIRALRERFERKRYDVLHTYGNASLSCTIQAAKGVSSRIVCFRGYMKNLRIWYPPSWLTYLHPRVDRIICASRAVERFFLGLRVRIPPEKLITIYKGHELDWYAAPPVDRASLGVPDDAFIVGFVGRNRRRKGIHVLVDSSRYLPVEHPFHYVLVGKLEKNRMLGRHVRASPMRERIHRVGFRTDAPQVAGACDVFVMPSLDREGFPRAVIEAMAYAVPPIVSDVGGMPELVEDGVSGLVVPEGDAKALARAIADLYEHPEKRAELGRRAQQRIADVFTCRRTVRETIEMYRELAAERPTTGAASSG